MTIPTPTPAEEKKKGQAFIQTTKGIYAYDLLAKAKQESSKQLKQAQKFLNEQGLVNPPFPPTCFLVYLESNPIFARCVKQIAIDVAGLGWSLQLKEGKKDNTAELERINAFLAKPNPASSFRAILKELLIDFGSIGWFSLEVIRSNDSGIAEIYHVPAYTLKVHQDQNKYCQIRNNKKMWFKRFGYEKNIAAKDGKETPQSASSSDDKANELIFHKNYYPCSDHYGAPDVLPAIGDVIGAISQRDYNLAFFQNFGMPSAIIILKGDWDPEAQSAVQNFIKNSHTGARNAHRTLIVTQPEGVEFIYKPLTAEIPKDASFKLYEQERRNNIMIAYSMPPERIGVRLVGKLGGNVAEEATKIYIEGVVEPLQQDMEEMINEKLLQSETYQFKFNDIDIRNYGAEIEQHVSMVGAGIEMPNEARRDLGKGEPYKEGDKFYVGTSLVVVGEPDEPLSKEEKEILEDVL